MLLSSTLKSSSRLSWYFLSSLVLSRSSLSAFVSSQAPNSCSSRGLPSTLESQQQRQLSHSAMTSSSHLNDGTLKEPMQQNQQQQQREQQQLASDAASRCILPLSPDSHKGSSGRIAVLGGSAHFTGAPYYAALASLKVGADLAYVFTASEAAMAIKCYSPELMVLPIYSATQFDEIVQTNNNNASSCGEHCDEEDKRNNKVRADAAAQALVDAVLPWLDRLHCLVIGPGLGRCPLVMQAVARVIEIAKQLPQLRLVLDADALYLLAQPPYRNLLQGYDRAVLTPNAVEYQRLVENQVALDSVTLIRKGRVDVISKSNNDNNHNDNSSSTSLECHEPGGWKRSGGIGDVLAGTVGTLLAWQGLMNQDKEWPLACWTACCIVRRATRIAFDQKRRSMTAPDVLNELGAAVNSMAQVVDQN